MKTLYVPLFFFLLLTGCPKSGENEDPVLRNLNESGGLFGAAGATGSVKTELKPVRDPKSGKVRSFMPLPPNWQIHDEPNAKYTVTGPNGIRAEKTKSKDYVYSKDAFARQSMKFGGRPVAPVLSLEKILKRKLVPSQKKQGYSLVKKYPLPGVLDFWQRFGASIPNMGNRRQYDVIGTEWADSNGNKSLIIVLRFVVRQQAVASWSVYTTKFEAPPNEFERAKNIYINGLANTQMDEKWLKSQNRKMVQKHPKNRGGIAATHEGQSRRT